MNPLRQSLIVMIGIAMCGSAIACDPIRSHWPSTNVSDFAINEAGTEATHRLTGLTWKTCPLGQTVHEGRCRGIASSWTFDDAAELASEVGGQWRLPTLRELHSLKGRCSSLFFINREVFPISFPMAFWSSDTDREQGLAIYFGSDTFTLQREARHESYSILLVRGEWPE